MKKKSRSKDSEDDDSSRKVSFEVESSKKQKVAKEQTPAKNCDDENMEPMSMSPNVNMSPNSALEKKLRLEAHSQKINDQITSEEWDDLVMSGQDFNPSDRLCGNSQREDVTSPTIKMEQRLASQESNRLNTFSRTWVQVVLPSSILLTIALFIWSNLSVGASVVLNLSIPETAESAIVFTRNIPPAAGEALSSYANKSAVLEGNQGNQSFPEEYWVPQGRIALICMFTSEPMRCMGSAVVQSMANALEEANIGIKDESGTPQDNSVQFDFFNFSLVSSVQHMWDGGAYALALLILILSGIWPYVKLVSMLILWFVPIRPNLRGTLLSLPEALGKWSLIDIYVFALMMAGFRFVLDLGSIARIKIAIEAKIGIFTFCLGVLLSHFLSHVMMFIHHNSQAELLGLPESKRTFSLSSVARIRHKKLKPWGQIMIGASILVALGFTIASTIMDTFKFTFSGVVGMLLPLSSQVTEFSLISAGTYIPSILDNISLATKVGEYFVVVVYYSFAFVTPILKVLSCLVLWTCPLTTHQKEIMKTITSLLGTWSALDVFLVSVLASVMEIGNLTSSIMGDACDSLYDVLGIECLRLDANFLLGSWAMVVAVISSLIVSRLVLTCCTAHFRRVAMIHLMQLKKKYFGDANGEGETGLTPRMIATYTEELQRNTFSHKFANLLAGSLHQSMYEDEEIVDIINSQKHSPTLPS